MEQLIIQSRLLTDRLARLPHRFLHQRIDWSWRLIGIRGARGVGKTTLLLQALQGLDRGIYLTLDDLYFANHPVRATIESLRERGYRAFFLDEVHKYPNWSRELKNLYDLYDDIHLVFTGSSVLELNKLEVDLSRRVVLYDLPGLSFREYLELTGVYTGAAVGLPDLLARHHEMALDFSRAFRPLEHFPRYLQEGYYPYFLENQGVYSQRLRQVVRLVLETDLALAEGIRALNVQKLARLLQFMAESAPFKPNILNLARHLELDRATVLRYLHHLHQARLLGLLFAESTGLSALQRPEKVYLDNPNLAAALAPDRAAVGALRETFFYSQLAYQHDLTYAEAGDFRVDGRYTFEVGGKTKTLAQIQQVPGSFLALDDVEIGLERKVPLWLFGWLY